MSGKWIVIGISGVTCGGKSTVVNALEKKYPGTVVIHQDAYFLPEDDPRHVKLPSLNCINWELMSSMDMEKLRNDVKNILQRPVSTNKNLLIVEGFLVLNDKFLSSICQKKLFFTLPMEESRRRRAVRIYNPPDVPGYYDAIVWSEYLKAKKEAFELNPDIHCIDGLKSREDIFKDIVRILQL